MQSLARRLASATGVPWPERPVVVALVITELDVGGAERALVALAIGLDRSRWAPVVIGLGPEGELASPLRSAGITAICLDVNRRRPIRAVARLARALRESRAELAQSFLFHANIATRLAAPLARVPWVVGGLRVAEREQTWHWWLERLTAGLAAGSVCVSRGVARFAREAGGLPADRLTVIPNGVDPVPIDRAEPWPRAAIGVPETAHLALFVGRLERQKGVATLLDAAARVASTHPDWHLALVGDGPLRDLVRAAVDRPASRVHWLGRRDDVPRLLKASDVLVLPSLWEGMPNVVLEAMAARRAVVATTVEGSADLVVPGVTGWLVPPSDPAALTSALLDAASDPTRLARFGAAGRTRIEAEFRPERVVASYEELWAGLLGYDRREH